MTRIDVIIPCYRYGRFLRSCVESVLTQSLRDVRVLIIDDASPDETGEVAAALAVDPRVQVVTHERNLGHIATYNDGIARVTADYLLILSADDLLLPGALERAVKLLDRYPDASFACGGWIVSQGGEEKLRSTMPSSVEGWRCLEGPEFISASCARAICLVATPTAIVRTSVQQRVGGYSADLPHAGDLEMWLRLAAHGAVLWIDGPQAVQRLHGSNMSSGYYSSVAADYLQRWEAFHTFFSTHGRGIIAADRLEAVAGRVLAEEAFWTGLAQIGRGRRETGLTLLRFAVALCPSLRYRPPLGSLLRNPGRTVRRVTALVLETARRSRLPAA